MATTSAFLLTLAITAVVTLTQACTPEGDDSFLSKFKNSDVIVHGYPRHHHGDKSNKGNDGYIVDFEVRCIFKGDPIGDMIRIFDVGTKDIMCKKTDYTIGKALLIYLKKSGDKFVPSYKEDPGEYGYHDEIASICGAKVTYPIGFSAENNKETCPESIDPSECQSEEYDTEEYPESEAAYQPVKSEGGGDNSITNNNNDVEVEVEVEVDPNISRKKEGKTESPNDSEKSGDMKMEEEKGTTTPLNTAVGFSTSLITSLVGLMSSIFVLAVL